MGGGSTELLGGNSNSGGGLNRLWGTVFGTPPREAGYPNQGLFPIGEQAGREALTYLQKLSPWLKSTAEGMVSRADTVGKSNQGIYQAMIDSAKSNDVPTEDALFKVLARRYKEEMAPQLSAAGLETSGPGMSALSRGLSDLGIQFSSQAFERGTVRTQLLQKAYEATSLGNREDAMLYSQAAQGAAVLQSLPIELRTKLMAAIFSTQQEQQLPGEKGVLGDILSMVQAYYGGKGKSGG